MNCACDAFEVNKLGFALKMLYEMEDGHETWQLKCEMYSIKCMFYGHSKSHKFPFSWKKKKKLYTPILWMQFHLSHTKLIWFSYHFSACFFSHALYFQFM